MSTNPELVRINVIGQAGSGKSSLVKFMAEEFSFAVFSPGSIIRAYAEEHGYQLSSRADFRAVYRSLITERPSCMTVPIIASGEPRIVIDGLRVPLHAQILCSQVDMLTLALDCPLEKRFEHAMNDPHRADRADSGLTSIEEFIAEDEAENCSADPLEANVSTIMKMADYVIDASCSQKQVQQDAARFLQRIGIV